MKLWTWFFKICSLRICHFNTRSEQFIHNTNVILLFVMRAKKKLGEHVTRIQWLIWHMNECRLLRSLIYRKLQSHRFPNSTLFCFRTMSLESSFSMFRYDFLFVIHSNNDNNSKNQHHRISFVNWLKNYKKKIVEIFICFLAYRIFE